MRILQSKRWRTRLIVLAILAGAVPLAYLGVHYSNPGDPFDPTGAEVPDYVEPKPSPFTAEEKQEVRPVLREFIITAVARRDVPRSWEVTGPSLKQGATRNEWRGDIPVVPYPAADRGLGTWSFVRYSYENLVGLEVFLFPQPGSGYRAVTADVELVRGRNGRWLVDYWLPKKFHGPPALSAETRKAEKSAQAKAAAGRRRAAEPVYERPDPSNAWWAVPLGLLSLIIVVPVTIMLVVWYQNRKAEREYLRSAR